MNLIVSTLKKNDKDSKKLIDKLKQNFDDIETLYAEDMNIKGCIGCNSCWLITPGKCVIKDDYEKILIKILQAESVIFITDLKYGFISYKLKNIIDRLLPLVTMYSRFVNGQMRHTPRYKKHFKMGLIYKGQGNQEFLEKWFERVMINYNGASLGAYDMKNGEVIINELINH